jgi:drug/metabolite transporter (DMT)-like permease
MSWQIFTAISVLGLSLSIILQRVLIHKDKLDPVAYAVFFQAVVGVILCAFALTAGFNFSNMDTHLLPAVASLFLFGAGHIVYAKTLQKVEASVFSVYFATHAIWVMALGILLLGESLTSMQIVGSVVLFASILLVVKDLRHFRPGTGTLLGLATGLLFGLAIACWSYVGRDTDTLSWSAISFLGSSLAALLFSPKVVLHMKPMFAVGTLMRLVLLGVFYAVGSVAMLYAYKTGTFSLVSPLRQTGIIVTAVLALLLLPSERIEIPRKITAALVCTLGVVLLVL